MDYRIDDEAAALRSALLEFLRERMPDPGTEPAPAARRAAWRELVGSEWLEHFASGAEDGAGPAARVAALHVAEAFGTAPVTGPVDTVAGYLLPLALATGWTAGLERLRDGSLVTALVPGIEVPGPDAVPRRRAQRLAAVRDGDEARVSGVLSQVACAAGADAVVVATELDGRPAVALVGLDRAGVSVGEPSGVDLRRPVADVTLDGVAVDVASLHTPPDLLEHEDACAAGHSLFLDAEAVGGGTEVIARTVAYCTDRVQFGRPIGSFQAVRHRLADVTAKVEGARSLAYRVAWDLATAAPGAPADAVASRMWSSGAYLAAGEAAVQCHGGAGFTWEQGVHVFYRAALAGRGGADLAAARTALAAHLGALTGPAPAGPGTGRAAEPVGAAGGAHR
ncbi:acyl-CoA/acyl-ACP dehydrogenase [Pseudonocardia sp. KRD-184]|uniref:Acyl-CoA/acyl-ACP dehydrogenase n=1 Tax=Pseudonocardia oceani TaxID=2792013 RepID=A0ABS6U2C8_9PSEU|nr:acyl-CoA dehydrogenase family protein [Pseudonocardia oceani]MBW0093468.1 acyl-CoA/acyl-ACP dehydrogenase [Pseudonocardia oceani]MBW0100191.1 acyl-CoA/acyl-ACP dehydrogenase [Pseudonocardia oceani]MBW0112215.1 acyl-CoA/acyl-ACP dehydrogenase [Pseudonocardia oceani]MBW0120545.1 acyl-CoA/acyl-ACP dehydrogenase [Pseudonocardia oceani]MBW0126301.1 acyl-CoA/acyl-ACP dehydrogenase [Pseudonocardia oceani]